MCNGAGEDDQQQEDRHGRCQTDLLIRVSNTVHDNEIGSCAVRTAGDYIRAFEGAQRTGNGKNDIERDDRLNARQNDVLELLEFIRAVDGSCLVKRRVNRHDGTDEEDHVLADIAPEGSVDKGPVVDSLIAQPVRQRIDIEAGPGKDRIQNKPMRVKELENEAHCNAVDQIREENNGFEQLPEADLH